MAKLSIKTKLDSVVVVGEFCDWDVSKAIRADRQRGNKFIHVNDMPKGEYRILSCKSFVGGEIYPTDGRQMGNRYFGGDTDEIVSCYF